MAPTQLSRSNRDDSPLDVVERIVLDNDWMFDRRGEADMSVQVPGRWCDYSLHFAWNDEAAALHFTCAFDMRVPPEKISRVHELLALANEKMWLGHFSLWEDEALPLFRHVLPFRGARGPSPEQMEDVMDSALDACERFYPAFQYVVWGGKPAAEALDAAMVDTVGEA